MTLLEWLLPQHSASAHFPDLTIPQSQGNGHSLQDPQHSGSPALKRPPSEDSASPHSAVSPRSARGSSPRGVLTTAAVEVGMQIADIYAAVRPTGREPQLQGSFPELTVQLRPYQRRAAAWMVSREVDINSLVVVNLRGYLLSLLT